MRGRMPHRTVKQLRKPMLLSLRLFEQLLRKGPKLEAHRGRQTTATVGRTDEAAGYAILRVLLAVAFLRLGGSTVILRSRTGLFHHALCFGSTFLYGRAFESAAASTAHFDAPDHPQRSKAASQERERQEDRKQSPHDAVENRDKHSSHNHRKNTMVLEKSKMAPKKIIVKKTLWCSNT